MQSTHPPIESDSLTSIPPCPICGYDLAATVQAGRRACPECGWRFSDNDLRLLGPSNVRGEPRRLNPRESRIRGPWLLVALALVSIIIVAVVIAVWRFV